MRVYFSLKNLNQQPFCIQKISRKPRPVYLLLLFHRERRKGKKIHNNFKKRLCLLEPQCFNLFQTLNSFTAVIIYIYFRSCFFFSLLYKNAK